MLEIPSGNSNNTPDFLQLPLEAENRLDALPDDLIEGGARAIYEQTLQALCRPHGYAEFIGTTPKAVEATQQGLLSSLEEVALLGRTDNMPRHIIFPTADYFEKPHKKIVEAMRERTDYIKETFMLDELQTAISQSNGRYIYGTFPTEHPEFSWVAVAADNHTSNGIDFRFFREKPERQNDLGEIDYHVGIRYAGPKQFPSAVSDEYLCFVGMEMRTTRDVGVEDYTEETRLELTEDENKYLGEATKLLVIETLANQFQVNLEMTERNRAFIGRIAKDALRDVADPVEARQILERMGIDDDPDNYR